MTPGYDGPRLAHLLADLPVQILVRLRSDRVFRRPAPPYLFRPDGGRPARHGGEFVFKDSTTWGGMYIETRTNTRLYGRASALAWNRLHPRLQRRSAWAHWVGPMPILEGTVILLTVEHLPNGGANKPVWLWWSSIDATAADVDRCWRMFLRRFDIEHTFRMWKQTLGWTRPHVRDPAAADRWTWLVLTAYTQLRLSRPLATDLRLPWEKPVAPHRLTPARVRRGFRHIRAKTGSPAGAPKPSRPGPGRPLGLPNRHDVGLILATGHPYTRPRPPQDRHQTPPNSTNTHQRLNFKCSGAISVVCRCGRVSKPERVFRVVGLAAGGRGEKIRGTSRSKHKEGMCGHVGGIEQ